jgi:hypothetical protein
VITTLLICHALLAVTLIGALTHQTLGVWWPRKSAQSSFFASFRGVRAGLYANAIVVLFLLTASLGGILYPSYRLGPRVMLENLRLAKANGVFELKEHFVAIGLGLLPAYWYFWKRAPDGRHQETRRVLTLLLAGIAWWGFIVGHILNNIRGFGL